MDYHTRFKSLSSPAHAHPLNNPIFTTVFITRSKIRERANQDLEFIFKIVILKGELRLDSLAPAHTQKQRS